MLGGGGLLGGEPERAQRKQSCGYFSHKSDVSIGFGKILLG